MDNLKKFVENVRNSASGPSTGQMDNAGYHETESHSKKKEVRIPLQTRETTPVAGGSQNQGGTNSTPKVCKPEVCRRARHRYQQAQGTESPWHRQKTYTLIGAVVLFIIWIIVYSICSNLGLM